MINKLNTLNFNFNNSPLSEVNNKRNDLWNKFKSSKNKNEKKQLLNQIISYDSLDEEDKEDDEKCVSPNEKVIKDFNKKSRQEKIAAKVARGEYITDKEKNYLQAYNPNLLEKSRYINYERKNIEQKIRNAKTKKEAKNILKSARNFGVCIGDSSLNSIAGKAVDKAEDNTAFSIKKKEQEEKNRKLRKRRHINTVV